MELLGDCGGVVVLCVLVAVLSLWSLKRKSGRNHVLPPGPRAWPIVGNVLEIGRRPHLTFTKWAKKYGPIFRIKMGAIDTVVITDHKLLKELFSSPISTGRLLDNPAIYEFAKGPNGIMNSEGATWKAQRCFAITTLKNFGFAKKTSMEALISEEVRVMLQWLHQKGPQPISGMRLFNAPVVNAIWSIVTGERCEWEVTEPKILQAATNFWKAMIEVTASGVVFAPFLRHIAPEYLGWNRYVNGVSDMFQLIDATIKQHKQTWDPSYLRDFIDHYLVEMERTSDPNSSFCQQAGYENLVATVFDLFIAGSETTSNTLSWALLYVSAHPKVQKKMQEEIDQIIGSRFPSLQDRSNMPYIEAVLAETLRFSTIVALGAPHRITTDTIFHGYHLPEGTAIFGNYYGIHHDSDVWGDPENFRPERFLNEEGTAIKRHEGLIAFSEGKRKCIGDSMAKDSLFLFVTSIFQQFRVFLVGEDGKESQPKFEPDPGFFLVPQPFFVKIFPRD